MSRAGELLRRLEHIGEPQVNEQNPRDDEGEDNDYGSMGGDYDNTGGGGDENTVMLQQRQQQRQENDDDNDAMNIDPQMTSPDSPYSRITHNADGSMKADQGDQVISDRGRFVVRRRR